MWGKIAQTYVNYAVDTRESIMENFHHFIIVNSVIDKSIFYAYWELISLAYILLIINALYALACE